MNDRTTLIRCAAVSGIVGGVLILLGGAAAMLMGSFWGGPGWMMGSSAPWWNASWLLPLGLWGLLTGIVALVAALRVEAEPRLAGIALVIAGALSLPAMGGFMLGAFAAIVAGACALAAEPAPARPGQHAEPMAGPR